jgi:hypothetical protein
MNLARINGSGLCRDATKLRDSLEGRNARVRGTHALHFTLNRAPESADVEGARLLVNAKVKAEIDKRLKKIFGDLDISAEWVLRELRYVAGARMKDYIEIVGKEAYLNPGSQRSARLSPAADIESSASRRSRQCAGARLCDWTTESSLRSALPFG